MFPLVGAAPRAVDLGQRDDGGGPPQPMAAQPAAGSAPATHAFAAQWAAVISPLLALARTFTAAAEALAARDRADHHQCHSRALCPPLCCPCQRPASPRRQRR